jgi:excisionase family DNA binding protein
LQGMDSRDSVQEHALKHRETPMHVTLGQAAKHLRMGKATLSRYIKQGKISAAKQEDGSYRIDASELDRVREILRPPLEQHVEQLATPLETQLLQREIALLRETLAQKDTLIADVRSQRDQWAEMARSLQEEKQTLLTEGRAGAKRRGWAWLSRQS